MSELTDNQLDKLYEMSEIHFKWFQIYSPETKYEEVLQLNHIKMMSIMDGCSDCSEDMLDFIFDAIIRDYKEMLDDYTPGLDDII
jgi:hypothetical protein